MKNKAVNSRFIPHINFNYCLMMKHHFPIFIALTLCLCTSAVALLAQTPKVAISVVSDSVKVNDTLCVPVTVKNFNSVTGMQYAHNWTPGALTFLHVKSLGIANMSATNFNANAPGRVVFQWVATSVTNGVTRPDNFVLYELCFQATHTPLSVVIETNGDGLPITSPPEITNNAGGQNLFSLSVNEPGNIKIYQITDQFEPSEVLHQQPYPNPLGDVLYLKLAQYRDPMTFVLTDLSGKEVRRIAVSNTEMAIPVSDLASGGYIWQLYEGNHLWHSGRVIKGE